MNQRTMAIVILFAFVAGGLSLPTVVSQSPDAPQPSATNNILYAHKADDGQELTGWMNALADDPDSDDVAIGQSETTPVADYDRTWTFTMAPALAGPVELDPAGLVKFVVHIGAGSGESIQPVDVETSLMAGETLIAEGPSKKHSYPAAGSDPYAVVEWEVAPAATTIEEGVDLVWTVKSSGLAEAMFMSVSENRGRSRIELPIIGGGSSGPILGNLTGDAPTIDLAFSEITNAQYVYNWTTDQFELDVEASAVVDNGTIQYQIVDGAGDLAASASLDANSTSAMNEIRAATEGNWTVTVTVLEFNGSFSLAFMAPPVEAVDGTDAMDGGNGTDGMDDGNMTDPNATQPAEGVPGLGAPLVAAAVTLGAFVVARRRRDSTQL